MEKRKPNRVLFDIPKEIHEEIKKRAQERYITVRAYVIQALVERIQKEDMINTKQVK